MNIPKKKKVYSMVDNEASIIMGMRRENQINMVLNVNLLLIENKISNENKAMKIPPTGIENLNM